MITAVRNISIGVPGTGLHFTKFLGRGAPLGLRVGGGEGASELREGSGAVAAAVAGAMEAAVASAAEAEEAAVVSAVAGAVMAA